MMILMLCVIPQIGQSYYVEATQRQVGTGWRRRRIGFGAKVHNLSWTSDTALADHERQLVSIQSVVVKETQVREKNIMRSVSHDIFIFIRRLP